MSNLGPATNNISPKTLETQLLAQQLVQTNNKRNIYVMHNWSFVRWIQWWPQITSQNVSNVASVSMPWCHHVLIKTYVICQQFSSSLNIKIIPKLLYFECVAWFMFGHPTQGVVGCMEPPRHHFIQCGMWLHTNGINDHRAQNIVLQWHDSCLRSTMINCLLGRQNTQNNKYTLIFICPQITVSCPKIITIMFL